VQQVVVSAAAAADSLFQRRTRSVGCTETLLRCRCQNSNVQMIRTNNWSDVWSQPVTSHPSAMYTIHVESAVLGYKPVDVIVIQQWWPRPMYRMYMYTFVH